VRSKTFSANHPSIQGSRVGWNHSTSDCTGLFIPSPLFAALNDKLEVKKTKAYLDSISGNLLLAILVMFELVSEWS
jgi:hypothetical protein